MMIDQICLKRISDHGKTYDEVRIWICGIPFRADANAQIERTIRRVASVNGIQVLDFRTSKTGDTTLSQPNFHRVEELAEMLCETFATADVGDDGNGTVKAWSCAREWEKASWRKVAQAALTYAPG